MMTLLSKILFYKSVFVEEAVSSYTLNVSRVGLKLKNFVKLLLIIQVFIGDSFSVKFVNINCLLYLEVMEEIIFLLIYQ